MKNLTLPLQGAQMLFVAFGALVLVPLLTGLNASVALFTAGIGTLIFQFCTKRQVPVFLASSFAFIAPIQFGVSNFGIAGTMGGLIAAGCVYLVLATIIKLRGSGFIKKLLPPVVVGPVIMIIGLGLAPTAVNMALGKSGDGKLVLVAAEPALIISMLSLVTTIAVAIFAKGLLKLMPILSGIVVGYLASLYLGIVSFEQINSAAWFAMPEFVTPEFNWYAIAYMIPVAIAPAVEHIGDVMAISNVTGKDFLKKPGLHRTLAGDGLATIAATALGGPPNTTYSEVTGAVTLTKNFNPVVMTWAAICAIVLAFVGKLGAALQTIPVPVMGGIMCLLFGSIAAVGLNAMIKAQVDLNEPRNLAIVGVTLVFGIGGMAFGIGNFSLTGISLCGIVAIFLNLVLPHSHHHDKAEH
ncbi:uracil-xanthine permease family protein [Shewanella sp. C32]|uniref:Uracil-xanthine permease family protein n=1 Tax=Shewanella electrica TaxID=515560 RepID=A0ABT2FPA4_9GAMM|nr:uracil-xanthine permease family protein [Shewanella electrica]MCH1923826.1 uracil-xanthine permease family protein [Shewanella electrica]MCS4557044.1 uracil-xanthine permease family protein [Shewanella electrica]